MKARYFVVLALLALVAASWQIAQHRKVVQTDTTVIAAKDQAGGDTSTDEAALRTYVHAHMGTSTSVFLAASYNRALAASQQAATQSNGQVYAQAQAACASHADSITQANCVQAYLAAHSTSGVNPGVPPPTPTKAQYTKTLTAPAWTPDSAGLAFLAGVVAVAAAVYTRILKSWQYA